MGPKNNDKGNKVGRVALESFEQSASQKKAARSVQNKGIEEQRLRERDLMMNMNDCGSSYEYETIDDIKSKFATDKFGNTILKAKAAEDSKVEALRAAAKARRAEKEEAALSQVTVSSLSFVEEPIESKGKVSKELNIDDVRVKVAAGGKLTHKEKKLLAAFEKACIEEAELIKDAQSGLASFSISMQGQGSGGGKLTDAIIFIIVLSFDHTPCTHLQIKASQQVQQM